MVGYHMSSQPHDLHANITVSRNDGFTLDIDMALRAGETTVLLGPNGAGKSTLIEALAGLVNIDSGTISHGQRTLDDTAAGVRVPADQRRAGVVFQRYLLFEHLDVVDNISFALSVSGASKATSRAAAQTWVDGFDLAGLETRKPSQLSGGQAQRVAVARALASKPDFLLLDEPLAALDIETKGSLRRMLHRHLEDYHGPRLLITHDPIDAFLLADRVIIIEDGHITQQGTPAEIARRPATPYAAALAGLNLLSGTNTAGALTLDGTEQALATSNTRTSGPVLVTIKPSAIALHDGKPEGSPRNSWATTIATLEGSGDITRVTLDAPLRLSVDITPGAATSMDLQPGRQVWASVKATEVIVNRS